MVEVKKLANSNRDAYEAYERELWGGGDGRIVNLCRYCKLASVQLFLAAQKRGIDVKLAAANGHVYNIYDGHIVDITATQFGISDRVFVAKAEGNQTGNWEPKKDGNNLSSLEELSRVGWCTSEVELQNDKEIIKEFVKEE